MLLNFILFFYGKMHMNEWIIVVVSWRFLNDWIPMQACGFRWCVQRSIVAEFSNWNEWIKWLFSGDILIAEFQRKHVDFGGVMIRIVAEFSNWNEGTKRAINGDLRMKRCSMNDARILWRNQRSKWSVTYRNSYQLEEY